MNRSRSLCFALVSVVVSIGAVLRILIALQDGLWLDELHTAWATNDGIAAVSPRALAGNQSALFFWLVWWMREWFGDSVLALRSTSISAGLLLIFLVSILIWKWTRSMIATILVAWLVATDPQFVFYSTEARPYGLVQLLGVIQVLIFWTWLSGFHDVDAIKLARSRRGFVFSSAHAGGVGILLAIATTMLVSMHATAIWLPLTELLFFVGYWLTSWFRADWNFRRSTALVSALFIAILTLLICLPTLFEFRDVFDRRSNWLPVSSMPAMLIELRWPILLSIVLPTILAAAFYSPNQRTVDAQLFGVQNTQRPAIQISFVLLWALIPIGCVVLLDRLQIAPLALTRYTLVGAAALPVFCGLCAGLPGKRYGQLAIAVILIGVGLYQNPIAHSLIQTQSLPNFRFENWSAPIAEINNRKDKATHPVFLFANVIEDVHAFATDDVALQEYLLFPISGIDQIDLSQRAAIAAPTISPQHFRPTDVQLMKSQGGAWLLVRGDPGLVGEICNELRMLAARLAEIEREETGLEADKAAENEDSIQTKSSQPQIQFAQFPNSNVHLVAVNWP